ncbi:MAG: hypothetical protein EA409_01715 [Saprospirales bacterium]|nr:MAG: hypothetical protein EA409_01715 [Saprospirales bacterium]
MEILEFLQYPWIIRALTASVMVGISCGILGVFIVLRNMALIGDALSHAILPGIVIAFMVFGGYHLSGFFAGAVIAGLVAAVAITWIQQNLPTKNDAAIGIIFTVMFSLGVIGISILSRNEGVHLDLKDFLFGNILAISSEDLYLNYLILIMVVGSIVFFYRFFFLSTFQESYARALGFNTSAIHYYLMLLLSFTVVASLQTVGVILVVAMLIIPASTAILWSDQLKIVLGLSAFIGALSAISGLTASIFLEIPPGPSMTIMAFIFFAFSALVAPEKGYISKMVKNRKYRQKILREDILKYVFKQGRKEPTQLSTIASVLERTTAEIRSALLGMRRKKLIDFGSNGQVLLTNEGYGSGMKLVRAHRLWETWLAEKTGLQEDQIHQDAEFYEHLLDDNTIDQIDASLGFPKKDPHGTPIPQIYSREKRLTGELKAGDLFVIDENCHQLAKWEEESSRKLCNKVFELIQNTGDELLFVEKGKKPKISIRNFGGTEITVLIPALQG